jgi:Fe-S-cluster-containing dehydrogenase component
MSADLTRRSFLKGGMAAACTLAAKPVSAAATVPEDQTQIATLLDIRKCIGCEACVEACTEFNSNKYPKPEKPFPKMFPERARVEDWSQKQDVTERLTPYNWVYIQKAEVEINGEKTELNIPRRCMHCVNPPCVKLCPFGAAQQTENGISKIDADICLGGAKCRKVCPWHIPQRQTGVGIYLDLLPNFAGNGVMFKCDRCYDRIAKGERPACIDACPEDVQTIGPRDEIINKAHALAEKINGHIYGEHENGGTNTIYVSPVPFEEINQHIVKGRGKPHFKQIEDVMANGNHLAAAMVIAPIAGIAAAAGKIYRHAKSLEKEIRNE